MTTVDISVHMDKVDSVRGNGHYIGYAEHIDVDTYSATIRCGRQSVTFYGTLVQMTELRQSMKDAVGSAFDSYHESTGA